MNLSTPLAERVRPRTLDEVVGHERYTEPGGRLRSALEQGRPHSVVLWGPPGCGKTTIARAMAAHAKLTFLQLSAVLDGVKELRGVLERARVSRDMEKRGTLLFVDEIHRWNKAQQDALLPHVESGLVVLVGATTENPSFYLNPALRSRLWVVALEPLTQVDVQRVVERALVHPEGLAARELSLTQEALEALARSAAGDARRALVDLERCAEAAEDGDTLDLTALQTVLERKDLRHDRSGDDHYAVVSALIKSMRGSDPDAALYWLARMLEGGEDPRFITRRLIIFASEDVGNADPRALTMAIDAHRALESIGMPEGRIVLGQAVTWLATCPKSNAAYRGINQALAEVRRTGALPVPMHLRSEGGAAGRAAGHGKGYLYPHDYPHHIVAQSYWPPDMQPQRFYEPVDHGVERTIRQRLEWWANKLAE